MLRQIFLSPLGYLISFLLTIYGKIFRPFMVYGYFSKPNKVFRRFTRIGSSTILLNRENIEIGENCWIGHHSVIDGSNGVIIGEGVQIAGLTGIYSHSSHQAIRLNGQAYIEIDHTLRIGYVRKPVRIGDYSFIGVSSIILPGVKIGRGCILAAGSILNQDLPDFSIAAGNPAKIIGSTLDMDKIFFDNPTVQKQYFDQSVIAEYLEKKGKNDVESTVI